MSNNRGSPLLPPFASQRRAKADGTETYHPVDFPLHVAWAVSITGGSADVGGPAELVLDRCREQFPRCGTSFMKVVMLHNAARHRHGTLSYMSYRRGRGTW
jgi:hypothetical protein